MGGNPGECWSALGGRIAKLAVGMVSGREGPQAGVKKGQQRTRVNQVH